MPAGVRCRVQPRQLHAPARGASELVEDSALAARDPGLLDDLDQAFAQLVEAGAQQHAVGPPDRRRYGELESLAANGALDRRTGVVVKQMQQRHELLSPDLAVLVHQVYPPPGPQLRGDRVPIALTARAP